MSDTGFTCEQVVRAGVGEPVKSEVSELFYRCPRSQGHTNGDAHPSLKVNRNKNTWACFVCGVGGTAWQLAAFLAGLEPIDKQGVTGWLSQRGLLSGKAHGKSASGRGPCVAEYVYRDATGTPLARKLRFEPGSNGRKKDFAWQRFEGGEWLEGLASFKPPLYRLPEIQHQTSVIVTEGEKDADAGAAIGLPTTTSGAVGSFREDHADALRGKHVVIIPDADDPGREHANKVAALLQNRAASLKVCEIPASKDLAEAIQNGVPANVLRALFEDAPEWKLTPGSEILDSVFRFIKRFVSLTDTQARITTLWVAHSHVLDATDCTPYLSINSAEKQSGKTRLLEILETLVCRPWLTGRATAAVLTHKIDDVKPTLLLDESDAAFAGVKEYAEVLRGILNTGYRRGGASSCCVGQGANISYRDFETFCPKAIAGIGKLPDTVADRSIPIRLKRARPGEVQRFRRRDAEPEAGEIKSRLVAWCGASLETLRDARPEMPTSLSDRQADCCEPLLAIADLVGGDWSVKARRALVELCTKAQADDQSTGVCLLADIRDIFDERRVRRISSAELVDALVANETSPWGEWVNGKPITKPKLSRLLGKFGIVPASLRFGETTLKGYVLDDFEDAFSLYLPPQDRNNGTSPVIAEENANFGDGTTSSCFVSESARNTNGNRPCSVVTVSMAAQSCFRCDESLGVIVEPAEPSLSAPFGSEKFIHLITKSIWK
jgi:Protein of unknown function (DUF3631)/Toprim-like